MQPRLGKLGVPILSCKPGSYSSRPVSSDHQPIPQRCLPSMPSLSWVFLQNNSTPNAIHLALCLLPRAWSFGCCECRRVYNKTVIVLINIVSESDRFK